MSEQKLNPQATKLLRSMSELYIQVGREVEQLEKNYKAAKDRAKRIQKNIVRVMDQYELKNHKFSDGIQLIRVTNTHPRIRPENEEEFVAFAKSTGLWDSAKVSPSDARAFLRARIDAGEPIPEYIEIYEEEALSIRGKNRLPHSEKK
jgi:hypothetical protein